MRQSQRVGMPKSWPATEGRKSNERIEMTRLCPLFCTSGGHLSQFPLDQCRRNQKNCIGTFEAFLRGFDLADTLDFGTREK